jgi:putative ABC transport system permease protein
VDQTIKVKGLKFRVIGVMKEEGESLLDTPSSDDNILIPFNSFRKLYYVGKYNGIGARIGLKGKESDEDLANLEGEITGLMRIKRGLKPKEENNFELNRPEAIANAIGNVFKVLKIAGAIIGGISMLIGAVGIANIMFVSVKERTNIIGIQKSLGAKNYFILYQFLFESVVLSTIGGGVGIFLVYLVTFLPTGTLELMLTPFNIIVGVGVSAIIGMLSGIIPASQGANMDPVIAIRTQ